MSGELLEILCQGDPLLLGDGEFLNVQPKGREGKKQKSNHESLTSSKREPPAAKLSLLSSHPNFPAPWPKSKQHFTTMFAYC